jgi:hypothetical protein
MRLVRGIFRNDCKDHFTGMKILEALGTGNQFALWWEDRRDAHQVLRGDAGVAQREFEGSEALAVLTDAFGEKDPLRDHVFAQFNFLHGVG